MVASIVAGGHGQVIDAGEAHGGLKAAGGRLRRLFRDRDLDLLKMSGLRFGSGLRILMTTSHSPRPRR
jgi:hypothetical protein